MCDTFIRSLIHDRCAIFIPQLVINEFCHQIYLNVLSEYQHKQNKFGDKIGLYKFKPNLIAPGHNQIKNAIASLDELVSEKELHEGGISVRDRALGLMQKFHLLPSDAFIGAIAIENKIDHIATLDRYFASRVSQYLTVFMPSNLIR